MHTRLDKQMARAGRYAPSVQMTGLMRMLGWDIAIPFGGYYLARAFEIGVTLSLLVSTVLAMLRVAWLAWRQGSVDVVAGFLLFLFTGGLTLSLITGDPRFLLLKTAVLTVLTVLTVLGGLLFLGSVVLRRPLTFEVAKRYAVHDENSSAELALGWEQSAPFRAGFEIMAMVWGVALVLSGSLQIWLIYLLTVDGSVLATNVIALTVFGVCIGWNVWFVQRARRLAAAAASDTRSDAGLKDAGQSV